MCDNCAAGSHPEKYEEGKNREMHPWATTTKANSRLILPRTRTFFSAVRDPGTNSMIIFGGISMQAAYGSQWGLSHANGL